MLLGCNYRKIFAFLTLVAGGQAGCSLTTDLSGLDEDASLDGQVGGQNNSAGGSGAGGSGAGGFAGSAGGASGAGGAGSSGTSGQDGAGQAGDAGAGGSNTSFSGASGASGAGAGGGPDCNKGEIECDPELGLNCDLVTGKCVGACAPDVLGKSHIGCEFWATVTSNGAIDKDLYPFGVTLTNTSQQPADVRIYQGDSLVTSLVVGGQESAEVTLPWVYDLRTPFGASNTDAEKALTNSVKVVAGAYQIKATQPLVAHQFSPLATAQSGGDSGSMDASLLMPTQALGTEYFGASLPTWTYENSGDWGAPQFPGFLVLIATEQGTQIKLKSGAIVRGGTGISENKTDHTYSAFLGRGDVLQLFSGSASQQVKDAANCVFVGSSGKVCTLPSDFDLTGSEISSNKPIVVLGGHSFAQVPALSENCGHVEESLPPLSAWGKQVVVAAPPIASGASSGDSKAGAQVVRILSGEDGNQLSFSPAEVGLGNVTLARGEFVELFVGQDFEVKGSGKLTVAQFLLSQDAISPPTSGLLGNPGMAIAVPVEQFREEQTFSIPSGVPYPFLMVISRSGESVALDGSSLTQPAKQVAGSEFEVRRVPVAPGHHSLKSSTPFGVMLQGYAPYASYLTAGGMGLASPL